MSIEKLENHILYFEKKAGEDPKKRKAYRYFLHIVAQPLLFSTDLLYKLWLNFKGYRQDVAPAPYLVVSDFITSGLCRPIGVDLFRMEEDIRDYLRKEEADRLVYNPHDKQDTIAQIARFIEEYIRRNKGNISPHIIEIHHFFVDGILRPNKLAENLRNHLQGKKQGYEKIGYLNLYANSLPIGAEDLDLNKIGISLSRAEDNDHTGVIEVKSLPEWIQKRIETPEQPQPKTLREIIEENIQTKNPHLDLSNMGLTGLEPEMELLAECTHLTHLNISNNNLEGFFSSEEVKQSYISQNMMKNNLTYIIYFYCMYNLESLNIGHNKISYIDFDFFYNFTKIKELYLKGNPIKNIPKEIFDYNENVYEQSKEYLESSEINEAKIIFISVGGTGKTTLINALTNPNYKFSDVGSISIGIKVKKWRIPFLYNNRSAVFKANVWNFAGQEINYGIHQFFLTKNAVYVFVWEARKGEAESKFDYWLNTVSLLSDNAPIFIVQNKIDLYESELQQREWKTKYPHIVGFYKTSCKTGAGIEPLREDIQKQVTSLPTTRETWNKHRYEIRRILEAMREDYIDYKTYLKICADNTLDKEQAGFLARQLHDIGVILRFEDILLRDTVVLKTTWATDAAYCLLNTKQVLGGHFRRQDLENIWADERFERKHGYLLNLMERFELIFRFQETDKYIVPEGLPIDSPIEGEEKEKPTLQFEYHYDFMPKAILSRFICRMHQHIKGELFWRYGVILEYEGHTHANVELNEVQQILRIRVWGKDSERLLSIIRSHIDHIHQTLKNPPLKECVPCICSECKESQKPFLHDYRLLLKMLEKNRPTTLCNTSLEDVLVSQLLRGVAGKEGYEAIQNALRYLDRADFAGYFEAMENIVPYNLRPDFKRLRTEYIDRNISADFSQRLRIFAQMVAQES